MTMHSGRVRINLGGDIGSVDSEPGATLDTGGTKRDPLELDRDFNGEYQESSVPGYVEFSIHHRPGVSLSKIHAMKGINITFEDFAGSSWSIQNAFSAEPPQISKGKAKFKFYGRVIEVNA